MINGIKSIKTTKLNISLSILIYIGEIQEICRNGMKPWKTKLADFESICPIFSQILIKLIIQDSFHNLAIAGKTEIGL